MVEGETTPVHRPAYCTRWKTRLPSVGNNMWWCTYHTCHHPFRTPLVMRGHRIGWQHLMSKECLPHFAPLIITSKGTLQRVKRKANTVFSQGSSGILAMINEGVNGHTTNYRREVYYCFCYGYHYYPSSVCKIITQQQHSQYRDILFLLHGSGCIRDVCYCYHIPRMLIVTDFVLKRQVDIWCCAWPS